MAARRTCRVSNEVGTLANRPRPGGLHRTLPGSPGPCHGRGPALGRGGRRETGGDGAQPVRTTGLQKKPTAFTPKRLGGTFDCTPLVNLRTARFPNLLFPAQEANEDGNSGDAPGRSEPWCLDYAVIPGHVTLNAVLLS